MLAPETETYRLLLVDVVTRRLSAGLDDTERRGEGGFVQGPGDEVKGLAWDKLLLSTAPLVASLRRRRGVNGARTGHPNVRVASEVGCERFHKE